MSEKIDWIVRAVKPDDFIKIQDLCLKVYPFTKPWKLEQLESHQEHFPNGQLVAVHPKHNLVVGIAFSLIVNWDDYSMRDSWRDFTDAGYFTNHDPTSGKTLYGAEVMTHPNYRGQGVGRALYQARNNLCRELGLLRIRAGARMRGYSTYCDELTAEEYLIKVAGLQIFDPTISFQIKQGFKPLAVVPQYLQDDPESVGYAAVIEWLNLEVATQENILRQEEYFQKYVLDKVEDQ